METPLFVPVVMGHGKGSPSPIEEMLKSGADSVETAVPRPELGWADARRLDAAISRGIVVSTIDGRLYVNRERYQEAVALRLRIAILIVAFTLVFALVMGIYSKRAGSVRHSTAPGAVPTSPLGDRASCPPDPGPFFF